MSGIQVKRSLGVNDYVVPVEEVSVPWGDPFNLASHEDENMTVSLVNFKATGKHLWLEAALNVPARWWVRHRHQIPLLLEIQNQIRETRPKAGAAVRLPRNSKYLLPLQVRGKVLWFQNVSSTVILAVRDEALQDLGWFLEQIKEDLKETPEDDAPPEAPALQRESIPEALKTPVQESLQTLREHAACSSVSWLQSKLSFRVKRKHDKVLQDFRIPSLHKKMRECREHDNKEVLDRQFTSVMPKILEFLSASAAELAASSHPQPLENLAHSGEPQEAAGVLADGPAADLAEVPAADIAEASAAHGPPAALADGPAGEPADAPAAPRRGRPRPAPYRRRARS